MSSESKEIAGIMRTMGKTKAEVLDLLSAAQAMDDQGMEAAYEWYTKQMEVQGSIDKAANIISDEMESELRAPPTSEEEQVYLLISKLAFAGLCYLRNRHRDSILAGGREEG